MSAHLRLMLHFAFNHLVRYSFSVCFFFFFFFSFFSYPTALHQASTLFPYTRDYYGFNKNEIR